MGYIYIQCQAYETFLHFIFKFLILKQYRKKRYNIFNLQKLYRINLLIVYY